MDKTILLILQNKTDILHYINSIDFIKEAETMPKKISIDKFLQQMSSISNKENFIKHLKK